MWHSIALWGTAFLTCLGPIGLLLYVKQADVFGFLLGSSIMAVHIVTLLVLSGTIT